MDNGSETSPGRFTQKKVSRRSVLKGIRNVALVAGGTVIGGGALWKNRDKFQEFEDSHSVESLFGKPLEEEIVKDFVTDKYGDNDQILVRRNPVLGDDDILGYTDPGQKVKARAVYGAQYESYDPTLGGPIMVNGEGYGKWYEINGDSLGVFDSEQNKIDTHGKKLYMAGNFLRLPKENGVDK